MASQQNGYRVGVQRNIMNRILAGIIFFLFVSTGYISFLVHERQQELQKLTQYTDSWSAAQMVSEYYRFESWLGLYTIDDAMTLDDVRLRLDIMLSQSDLVKEGDLGHYISLKKRLIIWMLILRA